MDPLSAIGLASAIIQFIDFGFKVAERLEEFSSKNPADVPKSLQAISTQLPLLLNALSRIKSDAAIKNLDFDTKCILRGMVSGCTAQIVEIESMINTIARTPGDSLRVKIKKVFTSLKYDEKVREVERYLHTYISVLILHHVIDGTDTPLLPADDTFFDVREKRIDPFVDRPALMDELDALLHDASRSKTTNPVIVILTGDKGVGKTQLALAYCYQSNLLRQFRTVFWLDASTLENLYLGFEGMYATIRRSTEKSREEKIAFVTAFLNDLWHPWLLVLDNYDSEALYNNIMEILPSRGYGGIILIPRGKADNGLGKVLSVPQFLTPEQQRGLNNMLVQEVQREDEAAIRRAVEQGADINTLIWDEWPVLHRVALFGLEETVIFLLSRGASLNPPNSKVGQALFWAAKSGHTSICRLLIDYEDKIGVVSTAAESQAAFNAAAETGSLEIMRLIFTRRGVSLNAKNQYSATPLQTAAKNGHDNILQFLMDEGVLHENHAQGEAALIAAIAAGSLPSVKTLCSEGKVRSDAMVEDSNGNIKRALSQACQVQDQETGYEIARFLLEKGAAVNPSSGDTPIVDAALRNNVKMLEMLLEHGADPTRGSNGWCALTSAIRFKAPEAITLLLSAKVSPAVRKGWLERALRYASRTGDREVVLKLLQSGGEGGIDIDAPEEAGEPKGATALLLAILNGHVKTAQLLIRRGAKHNIKDKSGRVPLLVAAEKGYDSVVRELVRVKSDLEVCGGIGDTALILAAGKGYEKVVKVLIDGGADREAMNAFGDTAVDIAEEGGYQKVVELLEDITIISVE